MAITLKAEDLRNILIKLAGVFEENKDYLNDLDTKTGDGDHGLSMARGFSAVASYIREKSPQTIDKILMEGGLQFNEAAGSTIGILMFSALREAGKAAVEKEQITLAELKGLLDAAIGGIMKRGKAVAGQKTILDSLCPALKALEEGLAAAGSNEKKLIESVMQAAEKGAESTRNMKPGIGRARWFAERSRGEIDPGAVSGCLLIKTVGDYLLSG